MTEVDYYELLECERTADDATLKSAYRRLAMLYHPDKNGGCKDHEAKFKAISEAYDCPEGPAEARRLRSLRPCRVPERHGRRRGRRPAGFRRVQRHLRKRVRRVHGRARRPAPDAARRRPALRHGDHASRTRSTARQTEITVDVAGVCDTCAGTGAKPGTKRQGAARPATARARCAPQQGFFMVERTCPTCHGRGRSDRRSLLALPRRGPYR